MEVQERVQRPTGPREGPMAQKSMEWKGSTLADPTPADADWPELACSYVECPENGRNWKSLMIGTPRLEKFDDWKSSVGGARMPRLLITCEIHGDLRMYLENNDGLRENSQKHSAVD